MRNQTKYVVPSIPPKCKTVVSLTMSNYINISCENYDGTYSVYFKDPERAGWTEYVRLNSNKTDGGN